MTLEISFLFSLFYRVPKKQSLQSVVVQDFFVPDYTNYTIFLETNYTIFFEHKLLE